jgi:uncharacterized protein
MLIEFYGKNFGCFRDEFRLSMLATDVDPGSDRGIVEVKIKGDDEPLRLLRAVAIYGPNASGKSTVGRAARALEQLISGSGGIPSDAPLREYEPFALDSNSSEPVALGMVAAVSGEVYEYEVQFDAVQIKSELLERVGTDGERVTLVKRTNQKVKGEWTKDGQFALLSSEFRRNALLLSLADILAPGLAGDIASQFSAILDTFAEQWSWANPGPIAEWAHRKQEFRDWLLSHLRAADVGISELETHEQVAPGPSTIPRPRRLPPTDRKFYALSLLHNAPEGLVPLPYESESAGTRRLVLLARVFYPLERGTQPTAKFIDEVDQSLHPVLLHDMIRHFNCEIPVEDAHAQLIFVTHDTNLLDSEAKHAILRRDQIYLTAKDNTGAARLYSVAEFKERNNLNMRRRYLQGRYGAIPAIGRFPD